jgi:hypothetical protein
LLERRHLAWLGPAYHSKRSGSSQWGTAVRAPLHAITVVLYAASFGVAVGILGCIYAQRLEFGVRAALVGFAVAVAVLVYGHRRTYRRPRSAFLGRTHYN